MWNNPNKHFWGKIVILLLIIIVISLFFGGAMAKPGNGNTNMKSGYISGGYGMVNATRLNWSIPNYDTVNFTYQAEIWDNHFITPLATLNIPAQSGSVIFNSNFLPNEPVWLRIIGKNKFLESWCDDGANWYYVEELKESHCTPDQVIDLYYFSKNNFDPSPDSNYREILKVFKYNADSPKGSGFLYQRLKI